MAPRDSPRFRRLLVSVPPRRWFHGISYAQYLIFRQALLDLGCTVFEVPIDVFDTPDIGRIETLIDDIRSFSPDLAIGLHNGATALHCRLPPRRDGWRPHLFTERLEVPTICMWDHAPLELATQLLSPLPETPAQSRAGAKTALRRTFTHPLLLHCSRDSGQIRIMRELGFIANDAVIHLPPQALPGFAPIEPTAWDGKPDVCFVGHICQSAGGGRMDLEAISGDILRTWRDAPGSALWDIATGAIAMLPDDQQAALALDYDQTFFWRFIGELIDRRAQALRRLAMLKAADTPVGFYGRFAGDVNASIPNLVHLREETIPLGPELAAVFARHAITIDVCSPGFIDGYSFKPINGFAAGGFVLVDRKRDFIEAFGELGEAVSYVDGDGLASKIEYFLARPKERREITLEMRARIDAGHSLHHFFARLLDAAEQHFGPIIQHRCRRQERGPSDLWEGNSILALLRTHPHWANAHVEHGTTGAIVTTPPQTWAYAAEIPIPENRNRREQRAVRISLKVDFGRLGVAVLEMESQNLIGERVISATDRPVSFSVDLPATDGISVLLRNTTDERTRATIFRADLNVA